MAGLQETGLRDFASQSVLEIGTGWDFDIAVLFRLCQFDAVTTADAFRHVRLDCAVKALAVMETVADEIAAIAHVPVNTILSQLRGWQQARSAEELADLAQIRYVAPVSPDYSEIPDRSLDICYSTAVMEHIRPHEVRQILNCTRAKLKPGGLSTHVIDLKDHFAYFQKGLPYNHFLRFTDRQWELFAGNPMTYTNRLSATQWKQLFMECGYELMRFEEQPELEMNPLPRQQIPQNKHWSDHDLAIGGLHVIARSG